MASELSSRIQPISCLCRAFLISCAETRDAWMGVSRTSSVASELSSRIQPLNCLPRVSLHNASLERVFVDNSFVVHRWNRPC